ncbi:MFS transporter, partial [Streptomyces sp. MBT49]
PMSDRWGRRRPLLAGLVVYVVATALCALAPTVELLVACRLVQGLAGAAGIVIARAVVRDLYDGVAMARFFSTLMLISGVAPVVAPLIGAQVLRATDWRGVFLVLTGVGLLLAVVVWTRLPETLPA